MRKRIEVWSELNNLPGADDVDGFCPFEEYGEVLGFNAAWVDEDYNPDGVCLCFCDDGGNWTIAKWCGQHDEWHAKNSNVELNGEKYSKISAPTHIISKPIPPVC